MSAPVPPYGPPIRAAIAEGDLTEMKKQAANAEQWQAEQGDVRSALALLKAEIAKAEAKHK